VPLSCTEEPEAIASIVGMKGIFKLRAADVFRVVSVTKTSGERIPLSQIRGRAADRAAPPPGSRVSAAADDQETGGLREQIVRNQETIDRLNVDLAKRANDVRIIQQISSEITSTLNLDEVLDIVLGAMERVLGFRHSMLLPAEPAGDTLLVAATRGYAEPGREARVRIGDGVIGVVAKRRTPMRVGNIGVSSAP
jgi:hypothetical protein